MFEEFIDEVEKIKEQIVNMYSPRKIILFGSIAKKHIKITSDIDICVIIETNDKRELLKDMYLKIECDKPYDIVIYTPEEWEKSHKNTSSFVYNIYKEGVVIYGG